MRCDRRQCTRVWRARAGNDWLGCSRTVAAAAPGPSTKSELLNCPLMNVALAFSLCQPPPARNKAPNRMPACATRRADHAPSRFRHAICTVRPALCSAFRRNTPTRDNAHLTRTVAACCLGRLANAPRVLGVRAPTLYVVRCTRVQSQCTALHCVSDCGARLSLGQSALLRSQRGKAITAV